MNQLSKFDKMRLSADGRPTGSRYRRLVTHSSVYSSALQLCSASAVLPILCAKWGSLWVAGLLYPLFSVGIVAGFAASPVVLGRARHLKHLVVAGGCASMGMLIVCVAFALHHVSVVDTVFLIVAAVLGTVRGISDGGRRELISALLPSRRQSAMVLTENAVSAVIVIIMTLFVMPALSDDNADGADLTVLFVGAGSMFVAAAASLLIGPVRAHATVAAARFGDQFRRATRMAKSQSSFRKYVRSQLLFVPVILSGSFYALHSPTAAGSLPTLVIGVALGLLVGSYLWRAVHRAAGIHGMLTGGTVVAASAAVICIGAHGLGLWSQTWVYGLIFLLTAAANQALNAASIEWVGVFAEENDRPAVVGFSAAMTALVELVVGVGLDMVAPNTGATWPAMILLVLDVIAVVAALRANATPDKAATPPQNYQPVLPKQWLRGEGPLSSRKSSFTSLAPALAC